MRRVADREIAAGSRVVTWEGTNDAGAPASSGVYFVRGRFEGNGRTAGEARGRFVLVR